MKKGIKYIYNGNPFYTYFKKHFCPRCNARLQLGYSSKIVNSNSPEAPNYDFSNGDTHYVGTVEFRTRCFHCPKCQMDISFRTMKEYENEIKK